MFMRKYLILIITLFISNTVFSADSLLTIKQHLDRLQREVSDLSETVFSDKQNLNSSINNKNIPTNDLTAFDLRIYDLEKDIKNLNDYNFEELIFKLDDLNDIY